MDVLLRMYAAWKGRRKPAQIIVIDGAAQVASGRAFLKGGFAGIGASLLLFSIMAPGGASADLLEEAARREALLHEAQARTRQATDLVHACLRTAEGMEETVLAYRQMLRSPPGAVP